MASYFRQVPNFEYISRNSGEQNISDYVEVKNLFKRGKLREDIFQNLNFFEKYQIIGDERPDNVAFKFYNEETLDWLVLLSNNILNIQSEWPLSQISFDKYVLQKYKDYNNLYNGVHHYETTELKNSAGVIVLKEGLHIPNTWKTNGNFTEINNSSIQQIFSGDGIVPSKTVTVNPIGGIIGLTEGSQITIANVSENVYNGRFIVTSIEIPFNNNIVAKFTYELETVPSVATVSGGRVLFTLENGIQGGNSWYYEYYDYGLASSVQIPSTSFVKTVTNFDYEIKKEEDKRNIFILKPRYLNVIFNDMEDIMLYKSGGTQYISENLKRADNIRLFT